MHKRVKLLHNDQKISANCNPELVSCEIHNIIAFELLLRSLAIILRSLEMFFRSFEIPIAFPHNSFAFSRNTIEILNEIDILFRSLEISISCPRNIFRSLAFGFLHQKTDFIIIVIIIIIMIALMTLAVAEALNPNKSNQTLEKSISFPRNRGLVLRSLAIIVRGTK